MEIHSSRTFLIGCLYFWSLFACKKYCLQPVFSEGQSHEIQEGYNVLQLGFPDENETLDGFSSKSVGFHLKQLIA
jgi:hypothetical protein